MLLQIPDVLTAEQVAECRRKIEKAEWIDGRITAGHQSARAKDNLQLPENHPLAQKMGEMILASLEQKSAFYVRGAAARKFFRRFLIVTKADIRSAITLTTRFGKLRERRIASERICRRLFF